MQSGRRNSIIAIGSHAVRLGLLLLLPVFLSLQALASDKPLKGIALVIGQSVYEQLPMLANPARDASAFEDLLKKLGFKTDLAIDETARQIRRSVDGFIADAEGADVALVYYSGHGVEARGVNYLVPVDAGITSLDAADENFLSLQDMLDRLRQKARITIVLLDACRSNPYPAGASLRPKSGATGEPITAIGLGVPRGMMFLEDQKSDAAESIGEVIGFAAEPGKAALDGTAGSNSPYATALLRHFSANAGYDFGQVMTMVTEEVYLATGTRQRPWTNTSLRRLLSFGGTAEAASADDALLDGERRRLLLTIAATPQDWRKAVEVLAKEQSLPLDPLFGMLKQLNVDTSKGSIDLEKQLREGAENLKAILAERKALDADDPEKKKLVAAADRALDQGAVETARQLLDRAVTRIEAMDSAREVAREALRKGDIADAAIYARRADAASIAFDDSAAAEDYAKAHERVRMWDKALALKYQRSAATALGNHGYYRGDKDALRKSVELREEILHSISQSKSPDDWRKDRINLGISSRLLGQSEAGNDNLVKAIAILESVLTEPGRDGAQSDWPTAQAALGDAYLTLGARESGKANLEKAVAAYEAVLTSEMRESMPRQWAWAQAALGDALRMLGQRESDTESLKKAVAVYEAALTEQPRESVPLDRAWTQSALGKAFQLLGERENGTESLKKAVAAYEAALTPQVRERMPRQWATIQTDFGTTLRILGEREGGTEALRRAVAAYEAALTERTRTGQPAQWSYLQANLGTALQILGEREGGTEALEKAIAAFEAARTEQTYSRKLWIKAALAKTRFVLAWRLQRKIIR